MRQMYKQVDQSVSLNELGNPNTTSFIVYPTVKVQTGKPQ